MDDKPIVLLVDDDEMIRELVAARLGDCYHIVTADNGLDGLEMARDNPPAIVVLDWMMPGLGGPEVCRRLKEDDRTAGIPVLLLTSRANEDDIRAAFEHGADDYLTKPFEVGELDEAIQRLIGWR